MKLKVFISAYKPRYHFIITVTSRQELQTAIHVPSAFRSRDEHVCAGSRASLFMLRSISLLLYSLGPKTKD